MSFQWKVILSFAAIYVIWGSTYLAILYAIRDIPPLLMSGLRFLAAGILLYGWCLYKGQKPSGSFSLLKNGVCGILMLFGGTGAVAWSEQYIPSSLAAVIVTTVPFWFILLDRGKWSFYFSNKMIILGLLLGFAGVLLLLLFDRPAASLFPVDRSGSALAIVVIIIGGIAWTSGSLLAKYKPAGDSVLVNASVQLMIAGAFSLLVSLVSGESRGFNFSNIKTGAWLALIYLVLFGSLVTYICYLWLLKVKPVAQVSTYVYINPIVAVLLGAVIAGERITNVQVMALGVILAGVLFVNMAKYKPSPRPRLSAS